MDLTRKYTYSVHRFIELAANQGDLLSGFFSQQRAVEGTRGHSIVQKNRGQNYQKEVVVKGEFVEGDFSLVLDGRIDGVTVPEAGADACYCIEEIKTIEGQFPGDWESTPVLHRAQLFCYAALYERGHHQSVDLALHYFDIYTREERVFRQNCEYVDIDSIFSGYLDRFFFRLKQRQNHIKNRDASAKEVSFPYGEFRTGQRRFSVETYRSIINGGVFFAQAATGIGKTMAALFPAVKALGEGYIQQLLYLTAKTTGRAMAETAIGDLADHGLEVSTVTLTAKDKICLSPKGTRCNGDDCVYAKRYFDKLRQLEDDGEFYSRKMWDGAAFTSLAKKLEICPFELSLEWGLQADILIGDFNHLFDPLVALKRYFATDEPKSVLIDESHNLPDRAREMYSCRLSKEHILSCRRNFGAEFPLVKKSLGRLNRKLLALQKLALLEPGNILMEPKIDESFIQNIRECLGSLDEGVRTRPESPKRNDLMDLLFYLRFFLQILVLKRDGSHRSWVQVKTRHCTLELFCQDPAYFTTQAMEKCHSSILFSATLEPIDYFQQVLCEEPKSTTLSLGSPFPPKNLKVIARTDLDTRYQYRQDGLPGLVEAIFTLRKEYMGHQMVFFPSFAYLQDAADCFRRHYDTPIFLQRSGMDLADRNAMIELFDEKGEHLVFAVMGGIFAEGLDLRGEKLSALSIVSVGLPSLCMERELIKEHYDQKQNRGFDYSYRYPGWNRVLQAAGRLIRSETDRGIIQLLGKRFSTPFYRNLFPAHWGNVVNVDNIESQARLIREFKAVDLN